MGLASALTTALTGLTAAETQIDVVGNNLANSQTVGFKASDTVFATQFLQTRSLGSSPTGSSGGTNPRQIGLGTQVAEIAPDFTQGTIEVSSSPSDLAIQGDGFLIVEGSSGETLYTRNGQLKTNAASELVTVTGNRLLGHGVDDEFRIQSTSLQPITIPVGASAVAQATENVFFTGTLSPNGVIADQAGVLESATLGDAAVPRPDVIDDANGNGIVDGGENPSRVSVATIPDSSVITSTEINSGVGAHAAGSVYQYRYSFIDSSGNETLGSDPITHTVAAADSDIELDVLPSDSDYEQLRIYRTEDGGTTFYRLADINMADTVNPYVDNTLDAGLDLGTEVNDATINGNYTYVITFHRNGEEESRPSAQIGPLNVVNSRSHLEDLPIPPVPAVGDGFPAYDKVRIYRNLSSDAASFYLVDTIDPGETYTDNKSDAEISDLAILGNKTLDIDGPKIASNTLLTNVVRRENNEYVNQFSEGTLVFNSEKGEKSLAAQEFEITEFSTVQDLLEFMHDSMGIQTSADDPQNPVPGSTNAIIGESGTLAPGATVNDGKIRFVSNNGASNALDKFTFVVNKSDGTVGEPNLSFGSIQSAVGENISGDVSVFDSLGTEINLTLNLALESRNDTSATYRWYADSKDNDPISGTEISVGTGLISFDSNGSFLNASNASISIDRRNVPASSPLNFDLDFSEVSALATDESAFSADRQDGFGTGKLTSYIVGEDGIVRGVFSNGATRDLGQIRMARFSNPSGLEQRGQNMFASGVNSGLAVQGNPGNEGIGSIVAGAVELSNSDIGRNLIDLVLATTQYRGNTRVINTAQQLLDELLNLRR